MAIPKYGFFKPVRTCDLCYDELVFKTSKKTEKSVEHPEELSEDEQLRLAMEISAREYKEESKNTDPTGTPTAPCPESLNPSGPGICSSSGKNNNKQEIPSNHYPGQADPSYAQIDLSPAQIESIHTLAELIPQLRQSALSDPCKMIEIDGARELLERMNNIRLLLVRNISACNSETRTIQKELAVVKKLEILWNHLVKEELKNMGNFHIGDTENTLTQDARVSHHDPLPSDLHDTSLDYVIGDPMHSELHADDNTDVLGSIFGADNYPVDTAAPQSMQKDAPKIKLIHDDDE